MRTDLALSKPVCVNAPLMIAPAPAGRAAAGQAPERIPARPATTEIGMMSSDGSS